MTQDLGRTTPTYHLIEVSRLISYVSQHTVDSEQTPIRPDEIPTIVNQLIERLIWEYPCLNEVLQELLDELHFSI
jgi:hypothetical protein